MKKKHGRNIRKSETEILSEQSLSDDYWDGYYSLGSSHIAKFSDHSDRCARISVFSLRDGSLTDEFDVMYREDSRFAFLADSLSSKGYGGIGIRLSGSLSNPDREDMIERILQTGDYFELLKIKGLIDTLKSRTIRGLNGAMGNRVLSDRNYDGFYGLSDGRLLYCRDLNCWDCEYLDRIADGVALCLILRPDRFSEIDSEKIIRPYLEGDTFSDIMDELAKDNISVRSVIARKGNELFGILSDALDGNEGSASVAAHQLRCEIRIPRKG